LFLKRPHEAIAQLDERLIVDQKAEEPCRDGRAAAAPQQLMTIGLLLG
jgi:hypothetical protein